MAHPSSVAVILVMGGAIAGGITTLLVPYRVLDTPHLRGASLVLSPLITGIVMKAYGSRRERQGLKPSYVATFWGGALFAFAMAAVRFTFVK
jgi:hypothetical protein